MKSCTRLLESDDLDNAKSTAPERLRFSWGCTAHQDFVEDFKQGRILPAADFAFWILPSTRFETETSKNSGDKASNPLTTALLSFSSTSPHDRFWILDSGVTREKPMVVAICWELLRGHWTAFSRRRHSRRSLIALARLAAEQAVFVVELDPWCQSEQRLRRQRQLQLLLLLQQLPSQLYPCLQ